MSIVYQQFNDIIKQRMALYKQRRLGVDKNGIYEINKKEYAHILPKDLYKLNIIEIYRQEFWNFFNTVDIKLHRDFHHLNSSQAMCFNLIYPLLCEDKLDMLLNMLQINNEPIIYSSFEKILNSNEGTNFDFFITTNKRNIFIEIKYTERDFGIAINDKSHMNKYNNVYADMFANKISDKFKTPEQFFQQYQIIRNILYIDDPGDLVVFLYPKANEKLVKYNSLIKNDIINFQYRENVKVIYLEDIVKSLMESCTGLDFKIKEHYELFYEKYCLS